MARIRQDARDGQRLTSDTTDNMQNDFLKVVVVSMNDGHNVKCPRCWHWHGMTENFGHEPGAVLPDNRDPEKEKLCDRCQKIILTDYPTHPSVPHIKSAMTAQQANYARMPNAELSDSRPL